MSNTPRKALDGVNFLHELLVENRYKLLRHCHQPIVFDQTNILHGDLLPPFRVNPEHEKDDVFDPDLVLILDRKPKTNHHGDRHT